MLAIIVSGSISLVNISVCPSLGMSTGLIPGGVPGDMWKHERIFRWTCSWEQVCVSKIAWRNAERQS